MDDTPERHAAIPATARWSAEFEAWEDGGLDASGALNGDCQSYRADGSLWMRYSYELGVRSGPFRVYHPNGELAREGQFVAGAPHGVVTSHRSLERSPEGLRACCVPENARSMRAEYDRGRLLAERFFDAEGRLLLSNGSVAPSRPAKLAPNAEYDELGERWVLVEPEGELNVFHFYDQTSALVQTDAYRGHSRVRTRLFAHDGSLRREEHFDEAGRLCGTRFIRFQEDDPSPYHDRRIVAETAHFEVGQAISEASFERNDGSRLRVQRGHALHDPSFDATVFADSELDAPALLAYARELIDAGQVRYALCAAARASARSQSAAPLSELLGEVVAPLTVEAARELALGLDRDEAPTSAQLLDALIVGADAGTVFRILAKVLPNRARSAHDFVDAALLLNPNDSDAYLTRAMTRLELGRVEDALADAAKLESHSPGLAGFVRSYAQLLFPQWKFTPPGDIDAASFEGLSDTPQQPLAAIRHTAQIYASRLFQLRGAVLARSGRSDSPAWLPPELPELLPNGPVALAHYSATLVDEGEDGEPAQSSEVEIDERLQTEGAPLLELQAQARREWAALCWLCWVAGEKRVTLPEKLEPPGDFAAAASVVITRASRVADTLATGGLRARVQGVPSFEWEGADVDELPRLFARLACEEYAELRTLFLWLCFAENRSPFQSDLRE